MSDDSSEDLTKPIDVRTLTQPEDLALRGSGRATPATLTPAVQVEAKERAIEPDETSVYGLMVMARRLHADGSFAASLDVCQRVLTLAPANEEAAALALRNRDLAGLSAPDDAVEAKIPARRRANTAVFESDTLEALRKKSADDEVSETSNEQRSFGNIGEALAAATSELPAIELPLSTRPTVQRSAVIPRAATPTGLRAVATSDEATTLRSIGGRYAIPLVTQTDPSSWGALGHEAGYLISRIDGVLTYEEVLEVSGMARAEALSILVELHKKGIIEAS